METRPPCRAVMRSDWALISSNLTTDIMWFDIRISLVLGNYRLVFGWETGDELSIWLRNERDYPKTFNLLRITFPVKSYAQTSELFYCGKRPPLWLILLATFAGARYHPDNEGGEFEFPDNSSAEHFMWSLSPYWSNKNFIKIPF